jgi:hypothetical protein
VQRHGPWCPKEPRVIRCYLRANAQFNNTQRAGDGRDGCRCSSGQSPCRELLLRCSRPNATRSAVASP